MNDADVALFQQAQEIANSGQQGPAYQLFCRLRERNPDVEILFGIATTTNDPTEARLMIDIIRQNEPNHPMLPRLQAVHLQKAHTSYIAATSMEVASQQIVNAVPGLANPILLCPYCQQRTHAQVKYRISTGGWVWFAAFFVIFLSFLWAPTTAENMKNMEITAFFFLAIGIVGMLLIHKRIYICGNCSSKIADAH